ncbi:MAG TPA: hypothetical protein VGD77_03245 [Gemmatimonadaceae bacterium]
MTVVRRVMVGVAGFILAAAAVPAVARAQGVEAHLQPEARVDLLAGAITAVHAGVGVNIPVGYYARVGLVGAAGARLSGDAGASARVDAIARFLFDPFFEKRWGLSAGGGVSVRYDEGAGWRPFLAVVVDLEPPGRGPVIPAVQVGVGGGVRVGIALRKRDGRRR